MFQCCILTIICTISTADLLVHQADEFDFFKKIVDNYYLIQNSQAVKKSAANPDQAAPNSPKLSLSINLPSQPFLGRHLGFHIFFHHSLFEGRTLFLQLGCFGLDFTSFCICIPQNQPMASFGAFLTHLFFLSTGRRKDEADEYF